MEKRVDQWTRDPFDKETQAAVRAMSEKEREDAFYKTLSFGTGGMRGVMGPGTNRINVYTIRGATQGLANVLKTKQKPLRVAISYDCRHNSALFASEAAKTLAANGIDVDLARALRPTPFLSFLCRKNGCDAAIMITASHNPPEYNGFKVYGADGAQVVSPEAEAIVDAVNAIDDLAAIRTEESPRIRMTTEEDDVAYIEAIAALQRAPKKASPLKIVYTSLHGTGITLMEKALRAFGFTHISVVSSQATPDGAFPTVASPNPESREALAEGEKELANADILLANDPDADRIACMVMHKGQPRMLNGNETAIVLLHHLLSYDVPKNGAVVASIVTTRLLKTMAEKAGLAYFDVLTGFKYIGEKIREWERSGEHTFLFGAEQSYGYLVGTYARDKDGIAIGALLAETAHVAKESGKTLVDILDEIYRKEGLYREKERNVVFGEGKAAAEKMAAFMAGLRTNPPRDIGGRRVTKTIDYKKGIGDLPKTDAIALYLEGESHLIVRPSGTEPKIKLYGFAHDDTTLEEILRFNALI